MALAMPSPYKHSSTGVYWLRQRVPAKHKAQARGQTVSVMIGGKLSRAKLGDEVKVSLGTKDPAEAKRLTAEVLPQFNAIWDSFANAPARLTHKQIVALSGEAYRAFSALEDDPGDPEIWQRVRSANEAAFTGDILYIGNETQRHEEAMRRRFGAFVDATLQRKHLRVDEQTYGKLLEQFGKAMDEASELLHRRSLGDYRPDTNSERFPPVTVEPRQNAASHKRLTIIRFDQLARRDRHPSADWGPW
ncbi:DUF6538 domain-containing protein [Pelagibacterium lacus]|uniref:DUF6538 domain-containing protein n=1 Tax=Pelagibacterium lacus TaxID=2282655 RepID=UPI0011C04D99|nr:DUF6538 domain-containing protein [Pelagibacterium lacus]